jgi:HD superfamily phosphohydrolase
VHECWTVPGSFAQGDYFMRDAQMLGMKVGYDWGRMLRFARVAMFEGQLHVCFHEKEAWQLYELFHSRYTLHKRAYQHRVAKVVELMMIEALVLADDVVTIPGTAGNRVRISDAVTDMEAYTRLTDTIFSAIELSDDARLAQAQRLLQRVDRRELYKYIGQVVLPPPGALLGSPKAVAVFAAYGEQSSVCHQLCVC